jgi:hypothetical protein
MCPNHALQPLYYTISVKQYHVVERVLDSGYIKVESSVMFDETDTEQLECEAGCIISPLEIGAHPALLIDM